MPSQAAGFAELLVGGVLVTMGITGAGVRDVLAGRAKSPAPISGGAGAAAGPRDAADQSVAEIVGGSALADRLVKVALSQEGVREGTAQQARYAASVGISAAEAWCGAFAGWVLKQVGIEPPPGAAGVINWASWSGGEGIGTDLSKARPGDLLRYGSRHIGIYLGGGRSISGNASNQVLIGPVDSDLTEIIRIKGLYRAVGGGILNGFGRQLGIDRKGR